MTPTRGGRQFPSGVAEKKNIAVGICIHTVRMYVHICVVSFYPQRLLFVVG